ncbi:MAG TPA: hypothetical protein VF559_03655 [Caulobacteraceae bacterium]|jgi:hypothetical protein
MAEDLELQALETEWRDRFGEPLPMRTEPDLIRRVLAEVVRAVQAPVAQTA